MRVQHSVDVELPARDVADVLVSGPAKWFPRLTSKNAVKVGIHVAGVPIRKRVVVEIGQPVRTSSWAVIPMSWKATFPATLFPALKGRVTMNPVDKATTRLTVSGTYRPPLGRLGRQLDDAVMNAVARATVKELAESIATRLKETITSRRTISPWAPVRAKR